MKIMIFLSSTYNYYCKLWRVIMKELPDTFYLYFCFFFFLTWLMKLDRSLSVKVSNISWFPGGDNDNFSLPFQHGYTLLKFKICFYYDLFSILFYFAIFSTISLSLSLFFFFLDCITCFCPQMKMQAPAILPTMPVWVSCSEVHMLGCQRYNKTFDTWVVAKSEFLENTL